jgi:predicted RNA binding protein YcfA (HicA-like mRNA interferase family)
MAKLEKLLKRVRNNPKTVSFADLQTLLEGFGFELRNVTGSHYTFRVWIGGKKQRLVIPFKKPYVLQVYVREALRLIEEIEKEGD